MRALVSIAGLVLALAGCQSSDEVPAARSGAAGASVVPPLPDRMPLSPAELPTTDSTIAVGNLDAQIAGIETAHKRSPSTVDWPVQLSGMFGARGKALGRIADYEKALALADEAVRLGPDDPEARLARATARATFHRFADADADLEVAAAHGASRDKVDDLRASLLAATGHDAEALNIRHRLAAERPNIGTLGAEAMSLAALGRIAEAEQHFIDAQNHFRDVSPFPLATLYFQAGLIEERNGRPASARELYEAARLRLPAHAQATAHLATLLASAGKRTQAAQLLQPLADASDDPEYLAALASVVDGHDAPRLRAQAAQRYDALLARHPEAFGDHAARFWLGIGHDAKRASSLAERNLALRPTADAYQLAIEAAVAAGRPARACALADQARSASRVGAALQLAAHRAYQACGQPERAEAALTAAGGR